MAQIIRNIAQGSDDGNIFESPDGFKGSNISGSNIVIDFDSNSATYGVMRFQSINIPQGFTIDSAYLTITPDVTKTVTISPNPFSAAVPITGLKIEAVDQDNALQLVEGISYSATMPPFIATKKDWLTGSSFTKDTTYKSIDIKDIIQSLLDRPGWNYGNSIMLSLMYLDFGYRGENVLSIYSYEGDPAKSAVLEINYTVPPNYITDISSLSDITSLTL